MAKDTERYKEPKIVRAKRGWFIALRYRWPENWPGKAGTYKRFEISAGVNYIHDLKQREKEIEDLLKVVKRQLQRGFDPFLTEVEEGFASSVEQKKKEAAEIERKEREAAETEQRESAETALAEEAMRKRWTLLKGFTEYIKECRFLKMKDSSLKRYNSYMNNLRHWLNDSHRLDAIARDFTDSDVNLFLREMSVKRKWNARTYNNHINFLPTLFGKIEKLEKAANGRDVSYYVGEGKQDKMIDHAEKYRAYSGPVAKVVKERLREFPLIETYVKWIYLTCMRPKEIRLLRVKDVDVEKRQIKIPGGDGKTGDRFVPISDETLELIGQMGIADRKFTDYVFGFKGTDLTSPVGITYFSDQYRLHIRIPLGLDDKYTPYGWKHTRVLDLIYAGFSDYEVMSLTGHTDYESFQSYKRELMVSTKAMQGKTVGF